MSHCWWGGNINHWALFSPKSQCRADILLQPTLNNVEVEMCRAEAATLQISLYLCNFRGNILYFFFSILSVSTNPLKDQKPTVNWSCSQRLSCNKPIKWKLGAQLSYSYSSVGMVSPGHFSIKKQKKICIWVSICFIIYSMSSVSRNELGGSDRRGK